MRGPAAIQNPSAPSQAAHRSDRSPIDHRVPCDRAYREDRSSCLRAVPTTRRRRTRTISRCKRKWKNSTMCTNRKKNRKLRSTTLLLGFRYVTRRQHKMTPNASCETRSPRERRTPLLDSTCIFRSEPHVLPSPRRTLPFQQLPVFIPLAVSNPLAETGPCSRLSGHLAEKAQLARRAEKSNSAGPRSQHRFPPDSPGWTTTLLRP